MPTVQILPPGPLQTERLPSGRRRLLRPLVLEIEGRELRVPAGFVTDYSSWPSLLPSPPWSHIDLAGVAHDALFRWGAWEPGGEPISRREADRVWRLVARSGSARASWLGAWVGWLGLRLAGWPTWRRYRSEEPVAAAG